MSACFVYGKRIADEHLWGNATKVEKVRDYGKGPSCYRCGLPLGTWQYETASDTHRDRTGHHFGTGLCEDQCGADYDLMGPCSEFGHHPVSGHEAAVRADAEAGQP